tara:strand:- start:394 stop:552 length:159 start_codon:yes stop_codon:yes gene_type:complete
MKDIIENNALLVYSNKKLEDKLKIAISGLKAIAESGSIAIAQVTLDELDKND